MSDEKPEIVTEDGMVKKSVKWAKDHPGVVTAVGGGVAGVAGAYGYGEQTSGFLKFIASFLGLM